MIVLLLLREKLVRDKESCAWFVHVIALVPLLAREIIDRALTIASQSRATADRPTRLFASLTFNHAEAAQSSVPGSIDTQHLGQT
jgi:hypothetical protein